MTGPYENHELPERPYWWLPHVLFGVAALVMSIAVVLLVVLSLARSRESDIERQRDDCEALHDGQVYETSAEHGRANDLLLAEIVNQQLAGQIDRDAFQPIVQRVNAAVVKERAAIQDREAFLAAGRPVPCTLIRGASQPTTTTGPPITLAPSTSAALTTTTLALVATTIRPPSTLRSPIMIPPTPPPPAPPTVPTATSPPTTTTIDCPGHSEQCNRPNHPPHPTHPNGDNR